LTSDGDGVGVKAGDAVVKEFSLPLVAVAGVGDGVVCAKEFMQQKIKTKKTKIFFMKPPKMDEFIKENLFETPRADRSQLVSNGY
jgi:hypothetical protein